MKPGIKWHIEKAPVKSPYADCGSQEIHLQETYLGFVWAMTYSLLIIYEEGVQKRMISGCFSGMIKYVTQLLQRARQLFEWAVSLNQTPTLIGTFLFGATHLGAQGLMARLLPQGLTATAQGYLFTLTGASIALASIASGRIYASSPSAMYLLMAVVATAGGIFILLMRRALHRAASPSV